MDYQYRLIVVQTDGNTDLQEQYTNTVYDTQSTAQSTADSIVAENKNIYFQIIEETVITS